MRFVAPIAGLCLCVTWLASSPAAAQYRNSSYGFDVGGWLIQKPSMIDETGQIIASPSNRPLRLSNGLRLGGETNFKMSADHWWFSGRVNVGFLRFPDPPASVPGPTARFDRE